MSITNLMTKKNHEKIQAGRKQGIQGGYGFKKFAETVKLYHPTLQQSLFRLIREIINVQADGNRYYDARNRASHEMARKLKAAIENECLPYI